jgi:hypothetical protein
VPSFKLPADIFIVLFFTSPEKFGRTCDIENSFPYFVLVLYANAARCAAASASFIFSITESIV